MTAVPPFCSLRMSAGAIVAMTLLVSSTDTAHARKWTDATGSYTIEAELFGFDDQNVVLQRADKELGRIDRDLLSQEDRQYLESEEAARISESNLTPLQTWTTASGIELRGRIVAPARRDVTIQRRRGRTYVNDRRFGNLPQLYQQLLPEVIEHFDEVDISNDRALQTWLRSQRGQPRTFSLEGVVLEVENGDEYLIPFFVFSAEDRHLLRAEWSDWIAAEDYEQRSELAFDLEAWAAAHARNQELKKRIAQINLNLQAVQAGLTSLWEVTLYPLPGNPRPPMWVVMPGRNSAQATATALQQHPGFVAGPVRRVSR